MGSGFGSVKQSENLQGNTLFVILGIISIRNLFIKTVLTVFIIDFFALCFFLLLQQFLSIDFYFERTLILPKIY